MQSGRLQNIASCACAIHAFFWISENKDESPWTYVAMTCIDRSKSRWTHKLYGLLVCMQMFCDVKTIGIKSMFAYNAIITCLEWSPTYVYHFKVVLL